MRNLRSLLVLPCVALPLACTSPDPGTDGESDSSDSVDSAETDSESTDTATDDPTTDTTDTGVEILATIEGEILDMDGNPLPSPLLQFCGPIDDMGNPATCVAFDVDGGDGSFLIEATQLGLWSLKIVQGPVDGRNFTGQAFQHTLAMDDALVLSPPPIVIPEVDSLTALAGATPVAIDDVLTVTIDPDNAMSPDFVPPTEIGGVEVPQEYWRVTEAEGNPVLTAWSFTPFGVKSTMTGFDFTIDGNLGLAADEAVVFWEIEKDNGAIHEVATGTVNADATAIDVVPTGEGLHELTWLLVTQ